MWRAYKEAGRPWPVLDPDPVIDYQIMEAVAIKAGKEQQAAIEKQEKGKAVDDWRKETLQELEGFR